MPTIKAGDLPQTISLPEGQALTVTGTPGTTGVVYLLDPVLGGTNSLQSWAVGSGALAPIGPYAGEQRFLVTCSSGSVDVAVGAAVLRAAQVVAVGGAGYVTPPSAALGISVNPPAMTFCEFGASFNELNDRFGLGFSSGVNVTGAVTIYGNLDFPSGNCILEFNAATKSLRCTPNGETVGAWVAVKDGIFNIPSGSTSNYLRVSVINRLLPAADKSDTLTSGTRVWSRPNGSWKYQLSFATGEQIKWLPTQGIGGSQSTDIVGRIDQITTQPADVFLMCVSGNDSVTGNLTVSKSVAATLSNADAVLKTGRPVILQTLPPRYGKDAAGGNLTYTSEWTAVRQAALVGCNRGVVSGARARRMAVADWSAATNAVDPRSAVMNGYTADGKHPAGGLAHVAADSNLSIINALLTCNRFSTNVGGGDYYDATLNPGGNLLQSNQGAFAGAGGTLNSGSSATPAWITATSVAASTYRINAGNLYYTALGGTTGATAPTHSEGVASDGAVLWTFVKSGVVGGLGDGWTVSIEGAGTLVNAHSYTERDGTRWQEFIVSGTTVDGNAFRASPTPPAIGNVAAGDVLVFDYDVRISNPADCYGLFCDVILAGGNAVIWDNQAMSGIQQGMKWGGGKMAVEPMPLPAGVTNIQPRTHAQLKAGGKTIISYKCASMRKVAQS